METIRRAIRRTIFPVLVNQIEREGLSQLARKSGCSRGALMRGLLLQEMATRQLSRPVSRAKASARGGR
jgi:hypothetical protein